MTWAIMPPSENPRMSTCVEPERPDERDGVVAIASIVSGTVPVEAPTPRLSKVITRCCAAMPSTTRGSQLSRFAARWVRKITGMPVFVAELSVGEIHAPGRDGRGWGRPCTTWSRSVGRGSRLFVVHDLFRHFRVPLGLECRIQRGEIVRQCRFDHLAGRIGEDLLGVGLRPRSRSASRRTRG